MNGISDVRLAPTQLVGQHLRNIKNVIAVGSGKGGVGKSTVALHLALAMARLGARVGVLDADIYGPSFPTMLRFHDKIEITDNHYIPVSVGGIQSMSIGYLEQESALIWRGPMLAKALLHMLSATAWDALDYLIIDLPPGTGDVQLSLVQKIPLAGAIVVTTPQTVATQDASKAIQLFKTMRVRVLGIVENMSFHRCTHCGESQSLFGSGGGEYLSNLYHIPVLADIPLHMSIREGCDNGLSANIDKEIQSIFEDLGQQVHTILHA